MSLSEIAEKYDISRQAVLDNVKKGEKKLEEYEEAIFTNKMSKRTRAELELDRIKNDLLRKPNEFADYFTEIARLTRLLKVAEFDSTVLDEVYSSIVRMQLECNSNIRFENNITMMHSKSINKTP